MSGVGQGIDPEKVTLNDLVGDIPDEDRHRYRRRLGSDGDPSHQGDGNPCLLDDSDGDVRARLEFAVSQRF